MPNSAKPVPSAASADLMDTIRTEMADANAVPQPSPQAQSQFAMLQAALGKFSDEQLHAALAQVTDIRLVSVLARRLGPPSAPAVEPTVQPEPAAEEQVSAPQMVEEQASEEQAAGEQADHRATDRAKVLRSGKIIYNNKMSVSDCTIRNVSGTGCRISMESTAGIPKNFTLHIINGDVRHECEVAWRSSMAMGVKFIG